MRELGVWESSMLYKKGKKMMQQIEALQRRMENGELPDALELEIGKFKYVLDEELDKGVQEQMEVIKMMKREKVLETLRENVVLKIVDKH